MKNKKCSYCDNEAKHLKEKLPFIKKIMSGKIFVDLCDSHYKNIPTDR